jgi:hypothetical protein
VRLAEAVELVEPDRVPGLERAPRRERLAERALEDALVRRRARARRGGMDAG